MLKLLSKQSTRTEPESSPRGRLIWKAADLQRQSTLAIENAKIARRSRNAATVPFAARGCLLWMQLVLLPGSAALGLILLAPRSLASGLPSEPDTSASPNVATNANDIQSEEEQFTAHLHSAEEALDGGNDAGLAESVKSAEKLLGSVSDYKLLARFHQLQAEHLIRSGKPVEAVRSLMELRLAARKTGQPSIEARAEMRLATCLHRLGAIQNATISYRRILDLQDDSPRVRLQNGQTRANLASMLIDLNELPEAEETLASVPRGLTKSLDVAWHVGKVRLAAARGDVEEAESQLKALESRHKLVTLPAQVRGQIELALAAAYFADGNHEPAEQHCDAAIEVAEPSETFARAKLLMAKIYIETDRSVDGVAALLALIDDEPAPQVQIDAYNALGDSYTQLGEDKLALEAFRSAQELMNREIALRTALAMATLEEALDYQDRADNLADENRRIRSEHAQAMDETRRARSSARSSERAEKISYATAALIFAGMLGYVMLESRRRREVKLRKQEQSNNLELAQIVEDKSRALVKELQDRVALEKSLERKRRDEAIGKLTGSVAHDFNNLLQVVFSTNELLEREENLSEQSRCMVGISTKSAHVGASIVKQLLAYARKQNLVPKTLNVTQYFDDTSNLLKAAVGQKCKLEIHDESDGASAVLDSTLLTTCLINLLTNATDAMPTGGLIQLFARRYTLGPNEIVRKVSNADGREFVCFEVVDSGKGMTDEEKAIAFEPFYTTKPPAAGTGLGLSSVYGFVTQSGGEVSLHDSPLGGCSVQMLFPLSDSVETFAPATVAPRLLPKCTMLVVEDEPFVGRSICSELNAAGLSTELVDSVEAAIELFAEGRIFEIVLSDIRMPGEMDGLFLRDWLSENVPETQILLMSGAGDPSPNDAPPGRSASAIEVGTPILQKPFTESQLIDAVGSLIQGPRSPIAEPTEKAAT